MPRQVALRPFWASGDAACEVWPSLDGRALTALKHSCMQTRMFPTSERGTALLEEKVGAGAQEHCKAPVHGLLCLGRHEQG